MPVSTLPNIPEFKPVFLEILSDGEEHKLRDIADKIAVHFSLTPEELNERLPSGYNRFYTRVSYTSQALKDEGLIIKPKRGYCQLLLPTQVS